MFDRLTAAALLALSASLCSAQNDSAMPSGDKPAAAPAPAAAKIEMTPLSHVEVRGTGATPLILIPGLSCDWTIYDAFMNRNLEKYTMYAVTLPGFGQSTAPALAEGTPPSNTVWLDNAEAAVMKLIDDKKIDHPVVMGHSLGGHVALRLAVHHGEKLKSAISLDGYPAFPMGFPPATTKEERRTQTDTVIVQQVSGMTDDQWTAQSKASAAFMVTNPERAQEIGEICARVPRANGVRYMLELLASDLREDIAGAKCPVMLVAAAPEGSVPNATNMVRDLAEPQLAKLPAATLVIVGSRHFIMDDAPARLDQAVDEFISGKPITK